MVLRQEASPSVAQRIKNIQEGMEYAKEAVKLDTSDGASWVILGNSYLASFFTIAQSPATLRLCMSAYMQAVSMNGRYLNTVYMYKYYCIYKKQLISNQKLCR